MIRIKDVFVLIVNVLIISIVRSWIIEEILSFEFCGLGGIILVVRFFMFMILVVIVLCGFFKRMWVLFWFLLLVLLMDDEVRELSEELMDVVYF